MCNVISDYDKAVAQIADEYFCISDELCFDIEELDNFISCPEEFWEHGDLQSSCDDIWNRQNPDNPIKMDDVVESAKSLSETYFSNGG